MPAEHRRQEPVGPLLGQLARVAEDDRDRGVANVEASDELRQPAGAHSLDLEQRRIALLDGHSSRRERRELDHPEAQRAVDQCLREVLERLSLDGGKQPGDVRARRLGPRAGAVATAGQAAARRAS